MKPAKVWLYDVLKSQLPSTAAAISLADALAPLLAEREAEIRRDTAAIATAQDAKCKPGPSGGIRCEVLVRNDKAENESDQQCGEPAAFIIHGRAVCFSHRHS